MDRKITFKEQMTILYKAHPIDHQFLGLTFNSVKLNQMTLGLNKLQNNSLRNSKVQKWLQKEAAILALLEFQLQKRLKLNKN